MYKLVSVIELDILGVLKCLLPVPRQSVEPPLCQCVD